MEPNEWRTLLRGVPLITTHIYNVAVELAREWMDDAGVDPKHITLEGRMVTPWRDVEVPFPPDNEEN